jgi:hypothetical protein
VRHGLLLLALSIGLTVACGKKGPPLAPLARVPTAPADIQAARAGDDAYIWFTVPSSNVSGQTPADVTSVDLYAYTGVTPPAGSDLTMVAVKVASFPVQPVLPPLPEPPAGAPAPPPVPVSPGFVQGATAVLREALTPETTIPTAPPARTAAATPEPEISTLGPLVAPSAADILRRYYFVVATSDRGRSSAPTALVSVPLQAGSGPPSAPAITYTESGMTMTWTAPADARGVAAGAIDPTLLPTKPLVATVPPTRYHVFEGPASPRPVDTFAMTLPSPISKQPLTELTFAVSGPVKFNAERCFTVRAVDEVAGSTVFGPPSPPGCVTPVDTFPPAPPQQLVAISGVGVINLIWEPNTEPDLAGYIVLRGAAPGGTLQALTPSPIRETSYRDQTATPGVRYVYAVVAVDTATPQNVSGQSNRVEDAAREP